MENKKGREMEREKNKRECEVCVEKCVDFY